MVTVPEIMREVLTLSRTDRSYLAKKLIESLETGEPLTAEEREVFNRRSREIRETAVNPMTLEQLQQDVGARLA